MNKRRPTSKIAQVLTLAVLIALSCVTLGCEEKPAAAQPSAAVATEPVLAGTRSKEQAMAALIALPELKAWSGQLEKTSGGKVHGALMEVAQKPKLVNGKPYWQLSFVENGSDAAHRWESFLVAQEGEDILVEDFNADKQLSLEQWRKEKKPLERTAAD
jgi:hypothetical protein